MKNSARFAAALTALTLTGGAPAQDEPAYDRVDLRANASVEVEQDLLIAIVFAEVEDNDQVDAAATVNADIAWAADRARGVEGIEVRTMSYTTRPLYANGRRIVGWVARQGLRLESHEADVLSVLLGELQQRVAIQSISYTVSDDARDAAEESLIAEAIANFNRRAGLVARELGRGGFRIVRLDIGTTDRAADGFFAPLRAQAGAEITPPEVEAGSETLTVTVSGRIELDPAP